MTAVRSLRAEADKYVAVAAIQLRMAIAYPADAFARTLVILVLVIAFTGLWSATFGLHHTIAGLTFPETLWYLVVAEAGLLSQPRTATLISQSVRDGTIAIQFSRPYDFMLFQLAARAGDTVFGLAVALLLGGAAAWLTVGPPPHPQGLLVYPLALALGWLISFLMAFAIGLTAFLFEDTSSFEWVYQKFMLIAGGVMIPLDFFPGAARTVARALPFASASYAPARLFAAPTPGLAVALLAGELGWAVVGIVSVRALYRVCIRHVAVNAG